MYSIIKYGKSSFSKAALLFQNFFHRPTSPQGEKEFLMKFSSLATLVAAAALLVACGGGGGGGSPALSQPNQPPQPIVDTTPPVLVAGPTSGLPEAFVVLSDDDLGGNSQIVVKNTKDTVPGSTTLNTNNRGMTWRPQNPPLKCGTYEATAIGVNLNNLSTAQTFTFGVTDCQTLSSSWPPTTITPIEQKVVGLNTLSGTNVLIGDTTWQTAVTNGTIKFVDTGMTVNSDPQPLVWAAMKYNNQWCFAPVHKVDGSPIANWPRPDTHCNTEEFDSFSGSQAGLIRHFPARNQCFEEFWNTAENRDNDKQVTCP